MKTIVIFQARKEKKNQKKRIKRLETLYTHNLSRMQTTLESKLEKASSGLEEQKQERRRQISG